MDPKAPNAEYRSTPQYAEYQRENFWKPNTGEVPPFNTDPAKLEELAKTKLTQNGWFYASSNAGQSYTHTANRQAFYRHRIIPRMLVDTNKRDTRTSIFGHDVAAPIGIAPIGINKIYHPQGELPVAKVAGELNIPYCLSTAGSTPIETVADANGQGSPRFYQLYMPHDDELTINLLERAWNSGFDVCILTVDTWQLGWRHDDVAIGNYAFYRGMGADLGLSDKVFQKRLAEARIDPEKEPERACAMWIDSIWHGRAHSWEKIPWVIEQWKRISNGRPFCLKGIQSVQDAKKAVEVGCDGIVVSNHAGRQVDGAIASLDALEEIVDAVGSQTYVMFDSGVRGGADVFKALALGAKFVFVGRLWIWGLSIMGEPGVRHVMKSLLADFDILMNVAGFQSVEQIDRSAIESYPKSYNLPTETSKL
ncbi:FMN-dependent alpha-hydroxy acid dehydrogenase [Xylona heveae TC161]|uniref:FMN-dependent alpha-hydroxy acid dehydrogenase n=1 Tax=Xylona heveae (strain CBS 132557 / TC161) TaxID=1328760 RepID=A0A165J609_XYLHT|nr:FMN-dependent alpha-hydroxy acid dehydrogenase [Xylona heveae TC161]KZF25780.1 FMN-dependent alpha-hydroxy acid dehydrogenase [Xylona heveae TC161]